MNLQLCSSISWLAGSVRKALTLAWCCTSLFGEHTAPGTVHNPSAKVRETAGQNHVEAVFGLQNVIVDEICRKEGKKHSGLLDKPHMFSLAIPACFGRDLNKMAPGLLQFLISQNQPINRHIFSNLEQLSFLPTLKSEALRGLRPSARPPQHCEGAAWGDSWLGKTS